MVELNEKAVEAARVAYREITLPVYPIVPANHDAAVREAIRAYLSALPAPDDGLVDKMRVENAALRIEVDRLQTKAAGAVDRARDLELEAATALQSKDEQIERLTRERDEARDNAHNWHGQCESIAAILDLHEPECLRFAGEVRSKFEAAEQQVQKLTAENERLREATKESFRLLKDLDLGRSIHNSRFPQQNIDGPLWAQIPRTCELARSALETQEGGK